ncbi:hypothetical protein [Mycolicibacterium chitae]|uniref:Oxidoreductase n=1 Tax=Mycolicibacterium chitae TaxID=1792 RepID=A0A448HZW8_MYCCI|nr:hypothetical protein [Mycolicibacterium chitae]MCV7105625.1 hypothetical protein [Mycolicibacterium chitae]VEG45857.1 oxidoreductase [Mycolicibacterium chitae]
MPPGWPRRWLTRALVLGTATRAGRGAVVPASAALPFVFRGAVNTLAG